MIYELFRNSGSLAEVGLDLYSFIYSTVINVDILVVWPLQFLLTKLQVTSYN